MEVRRSYRKQRSDQLWCGPTEEWSDRERRIWYAMATSRIKRKAEHDPDLLAGNNLNESFVSFGTPLPSLASTRKDQGEYVPVWKQVGS